MIHCRLNKLKDWILRIIKEKGKWKLSLRGKGNMLKLAPYGAETSGYKVLTGWASESCTYSVPNICMIKETEHFLCMQLFWHLMTGAAVF